jgi:hypothetical protein
LKAEPQSENEPGFTAEIASQCIVAYKAWRTVNPTASEPEDIAAWRVAATAADPSENMFSRVRKLRQIGNFAK